MNNIDWIDVMDELPQMGERVLVFAEGSCSCPEDPLGLRPRLLPFLAEFSPCTGWRLLSFEKVRLPVRYWALIEMPIAESPKDAL